MTTEKVNRWLPEWRSDRYGDSDFKRLETLLHMAYLICKDIDSTDMADHWPDEIRGYVAQAYNEIYYFNTTKKEVNRG